MTLLDILKKYDSAIIAENRKLQSIWKTLIKESDETFDEDDINLEDEVEKMSESDDEEDIEECGDKNQKVEEADDEDTKDTIDEDDNEEVEENDILRNRHHNLHISEGEEEEDTDGELKESSPENMFKDSDDEDEEEPVEEDDEFPAHTRRDIYVVYRLLCDSEQYADILRKNTRRKYGTCIDSKRSEPCRSGYRIYSRWNYGKKNRKKVVDNIRVCACDNKLCACSVLCTESERYRDDNIYGVLYGKRIRTYFR